VTRRAGSHLPATEKTRADLAELVPWLTSRQLEYWIARGWIIPDGMPAQGRPRSFTGAEKKVLRTMARLTRAGFPPRMAAQVARRAVTMADTHGRAVVHLAGGDLAIVIGDI
jgi:hypothetical protein